ncbi:MAG: hypothetical protein KF775_16035 [Cyclobacteriaceae bacterium]|nr:hypothetical protein [Cyclobacteriaceae bacterium]
MRILIVDDSNDKIVSIVSLIQSISNNFIIESAVDIIGAQRKLIEAKYDLLITDLLLPSREGEEKDSNGGHNLVREVERNSRLKSPNYIIGITQYEEYIDSFSKVWRVVHFSPASNSWKEPIKDLIQYIIKSNTTNQSTQNIKPTIYFEGKTDEKVFAEVIRLFFPEFDEKIILKSEKKAGASWVSRQIIIWAHSLKEVEGKYIKAIGLLDGDQAGKDALTEINRKVDLNSAQSGTFKILKLSVSYARHLIPLCQKGVIIPVTLEEMLPSKYWQYARDKNWLEQRSDPDSFLEEPKKWDKYQNSIKTHLEQLGLTDEENLYLNKLKMNSKDDFWTYVLSLSDEEKREALGCFKKLIEDCMAYFT